MPQRWPVPLVAVALSFGGPSRAEDAAVDYLGDVKPLLAKHCVVCHGAEKPRAGLRLDTAAAALQGGTSGPSVVPGQPDESELLLAVLGEGSGERMPLKRAPLTDGEVAILRAWIEAGAPAPESEAPSPPPATHWAFEPPRRPEVPRVKDSAWTRNAIDRFILARLEEKGLSPSPEADRAFLLRRASLDVIGLPPTPAEIDAFTRDPSPWAYERAVDRLLASPHYGERWGRLWLDAARYADSNGYSIDAPRQIWKYRDWVLSALNADKPFDEFTIEQLAGDLLPEATLDRKVATGFHRNTPINQEGGIDVEQFRVESVIDRVNTTGTVWLGLTVGCCQCHDHKYDPITQREYYELFAFFNNCDEPDLPVATPEEIVRKQAVEAEIDSYLRGIEADAELLQQQKAWEDSLDMVARQKQSQEVREAFGVPFEKRTPDNNRVIFAAYIDMTKEQDGLAAEARRHVAALRKKMPKIVTTMVVQEREQDPRVTRLLQGGDYTRPGDEVRPGTPAALPPLRGEDGGRPPNRLDLARWLVDPGHPLTARVTVNRLWQVYFGRGIVETDADFGTQGAPPSHPELLDWLATELIRAGWSLKAIHRLILTSAAYRQSSAARPELAAVDPDNRLLGRQSRLRLEAELVRDAALVSSGRFFPALGGPGVFPPQPDGVMSLGQMRRDWDADTGPNRYRRGLYIYFWRATPHPLLTVFDAPDATKTCTRRVRSNTPLQALTLLNDEAFFEFARALAGRVLAEGPADEPGRIDLAFRLALGRTPDATESRRLAGLLDAQRAGFRADPEAAARLAPDGAADPAEAAAWTAVSRVLLNLDEFITRE
jgi:hypothetical protein